LFALIVVVAVEAALLPLVAYVCSSEVLRALFFVSLKGSLLMMNSSKKLSEVPLKGINLSALTLLLLLLLEFPVHDSPLMQEYLPFDTELADMIEDFEFGHDLRVPKLMVLL